MTQSHNAFVKLEHGSGGALSRELIESIIYPHFRSEAYSRLGDATSFRIDGEACLTTDSFVVDPPFFPGSDIGQLAVCGTCNDLAVSGARPRYLTLGLILEEGFPVEDLHRVLQSVTTSAREADVAILTGDTKVVPAGKGGGIFINTAGIGERLFYPDTDRIEAGDQVIITAPIGAHGIAVLAAREGLSVAAAVQSDCAHLFPLCEILYTFGQDVRFLRDATRGGVAAVVNEIAQDCGQGILIREADLPVGRNVAAASDLLGLSPLEIANEGVIVAVVSPRRAQEVCTALAGHPLGRQAVIVGEIGGAAGRAARSGRVMLETRIGGIRGLDLPRGILLPRIC